MRGVFVDTGYWIAVINPNDNLHQHARDVSAGLGAYTFITSEMILAEVLNTFAEVGPHLRQVAASAVSQIVQTPTIVVVPQTRSLFKDAFALYQARADKSWSLTDCASHEIMKSRGIGEALTHDQHFVQMGFTALLR